MANGDDNKTITFEGVDHVFPKDFSDDDIKKALATYKKPEATATPDDTGYPAPSLTAKPEGTLKKLGRGGALGAASGLGIEESTDWKDVVGGSLANVGKGILHAGSAVAEDVGSLLVDPFLPKDQRLTMRKDPVLRIADEMGKNLLDAGKESWQGLKNSDPEAFAHGLGSAFTQILTLGEIGKGEPAGIGKRARLAKAVEGAGIGADNIKNLKTAMPEIVKQAKTAGIRSVGELSDAVKTAKSATDQQFNLGLAPIANLQVIPFDISRRILALETPNMSKTAEGRATIRYLKNRAKEYSTPTGGSPARGPWTYRELNAQRVTENNRMKSFYNKDTRAQAASPLEMDVSKAIRDGAAEIVYDRWSQANPGADARALKRRQGALWALEDHLDNETAELETKQLQHEGKGFFGRLGAHGYVSMHNPVPHAWLTGVKSAVSRGPQVAADARIRKAFSGPTIKGRLAVNATPVGALLGRQPMTPPPDDEE